MMIRTIKNIDRRYTQWLTSSEKNAAGRIGLFRILYSLYSLWLYTYFRCEEMILLPTIAWHPPKFLFWLDAPPPFVFGFLESMMAASLVLLMIGYKTRFITVVVFILSMSLSGIRLGFGLIAYKPIVVTAFYVPLFMMFSLWGSTYSIDSILRKRKGLYTPSPKDSSWHYFWVCRGLMVILAMLFFSSGLSKIIKKDWIINPHFAGNLMVQKTLESYLNNGFPINPLSIYIANHDFLSIPMQYGALAFETLSIFIIFSSIIRRIFFYVVPIFHSFNTFLMGIPFTTAIGIYIAFPDWQVLYKKFYPKRLSFSWLNNLSSSILITGSIIISLTVGITWNTLPVTRNLFGLGGFINFHTIWFVIFFAALVRIFSLIYRQIMRQQQNLLR